MFLENNIKINILITIFLTIVLPIILGLFFNNYYPKEIISIPLHSGLEVAGGVMAIVISIMVYIKYQKKHILTHFNYTSIALLTMGIIDIFHGLVMPGELFVWLHSSAVFLGGVFFISIWLNERKVTEETYQLIPIAIVGFAICFSLLSIVFYDNLPLMINEDKSFTTTANILNIIGGLGFFIASLKFFKVYIKTKNLEELLFAGHTMLFGIASLLFVSSVIWDLQWWLWHLLRLLAYIIALLFLYIELDSEIKNVEDSNEILESSNKQLSKYLDLVDKNVITSSTDLRGTIISASDAFCKISGFSKDELLGQSHNIIRHPETPSKVFENLWETIAKDRIWTGEIKNKKKNGGFYWVNASVSPTFDDDGKKVGYTSIRQDITDKKIIEEISIKDGLTDIYNRRYFNNVFPKMINSSKRHDKFISFIILDIDYFKQYNDTYGHQKGDDALKEVASTISKALKRADDHCFRLGGEEFGIIFKCDDKEAAKVFAQNIRNEIESLKIEHSQSDASSYLTASLGLVCKHPKDIENIDELYKEADRLLYKAKENGRNKVEYF